MGYVITSTFNQRNLGPLILLGVTQIIHCVKGSFSDLDYFEKKKPHVNWSSNFVK